MILIPGNYFWGCAQTLATKSRLTGATFYDGEFFDIFPGVSEGTLCFAESTESRNTHARISDRKCTTAALIPVVYRKYHATDGGWWISKCTRENRKRKRGREDGRGQKKKKKRKNYLDHTLQRENSARVTWVKCTTRTTKYGGCMPRRTYRSPMFAQALSCTRKVRSLIQLSLILAKGANARPLGDWHARIMLCLHTRLSLRAGFQRTVVIQPSTEDIRFQRRRRRCLLSRVM